MARPASESEDPRPEKESGPESGVEPGTPANPAPEVPSPGGEAEDTSPAPPRRGGIDWLTVALILVALLNVGLWVFLKQRADHIPGTLHGGSLPPHPGAPAQDASPPPPPPGPSPQAQAQSPAPGAPPQAQAQSPAPPPPPPPSPGVEPPQSSPAVGFGPKDQIEACLPILSELGVDVAPVQALFQQSSESGRTGNLEGQRALEKQAIQAAARLMDQTFTEKMAPLMKKATPAQVQQATTQAGQAKTKAEEGRLTEAVKVYRQALQTLTGD